MNNSKVWSQINRMVPPYKLDQGNEEDPFSIRPEQHYDPDKFPPDITLAEKHGVIKNNIKELNQLASQCAVPPEEIEPENICICCGQSAKNEPLQLCTNDKIDFLFLGQGFPLYFEFVNWTVGIVTLSLLILGAFSIATNMKANNCVDQGLMAYQTMATYCCSGSNCSNEIPGEICLRLVATSSSEMSRIFETAKISSDLIANCKQFCSIRQILCIQTNVQQLSLPNKQFMEEFRLIQSILLLVFVIVFKVIMQFFRTAQRLNEQECDRGLDSASDFTVMLNNLPANHYDETELRTAFQEFCNQKRFKVPIQISKVNVAYNITQYIYEERLKHQLNLEIKISEYNLKQNGQFQEGMSAQRLKQIKDQSTTLQSKLDLYDEEIQKKTFRQTTKVAFITLKTDTQLNVLIENYEFSAFESFIQRFLYKYFGKRNPRVFYFKNIHVIIEKAPEPDDVFWENCGFTTQEKYIRRTISGFITLIVLGCAFGIQIGLEIAQNELSRKSINDFEGSLTVRTLSAVISVTVILVNGFLVFFIQKLVFMEQQSTRTHYDISTAKKIIYAQFVNTVLLTLITNFIVSSRQEGSINERQNHVFQKPGGIADDFFYISLTNAFITPLTNYFDMWYLRKLYMRYKIKSESQSQECLVTQDIANNWFEGSEVQMFGCYAHVIKTLWITFFYAYLVPISLVFAALGLVIYYWLQKYLIINRYAKPFHLSSDLNHEMLDLLEYSPILLTIGAIWMDYIFNQTNTHIFDFIALGIACTQIFLPGDRLNRYLLDNQDKNKQARQYEDVFLKLPTDYDRANPITSDVAIENYIRRLNEEEDDSGQLVVQSKFKQKVNLKMALNNYAQHGGQRNKNVNTIRWQTLNQNFRNNKKIKNQQNQNQILARMKQPSSQVTNKIFPVMNQNHPNQGMNGVLNFNSQQNNVDPIGNTQNQNIRSRNQRQQQLPVSHRIQIIQDQSNEQGQNNDYDLQQQYGQRQQDLSHANISPNQFDNMNLRNDNTQNHQSNGNRNLGANQLANFSNVNMNRNR